MRGRTKLIAAICAGGLAAAAALAWTESQDSASRARPEWTAERTAAELKAEARWQSGPMTGCADFGRGGAPQVCLEHLGDAALPIGTPVEYRVRWRNLPSGAYIRVWSRNAAPAGQRWRYSGPQGAIAAQSLGRAAAGDVTMSWDGRSVYCAPADLPMMCDVGEVGRFVLRAAMITGTDPFWPSWPDPHPVAVRYLAQSESAPFTLDGPPQPLVDAHGALRSNQTYSWIIEAIERAVPETKVGGYANRRLLKLGPWQAGWFNYCARLPLDGQLTGEVRVCFPKSRRDANGIAVSPEDFTATSSARLARGLMSSDDAKRRATAYAVAMTGGQATFSSYPSEAQMVAKLHPDPKTYDGSYQDLRDAARDAGLTYVDVNQPYPTFRDGPGRSWWLVETGLSIKVIDRDGGKDWGRLALRVDHDRTVCRVDRTGARETVGGAQREVYTPCRPGTARHIG